MCVLTLSLFHLPHSHPTPLQHDNTTTCSTRSTRSTRSTQAKKQNMVLHLLTKTNYGDVGKFKQAFKHCCGGKKKGSPSGTGGNNGKFSPLNF